MLKQCDHIALQVNIYNICEMYDAHCPPLHDLSVNVFGNTCQLLGVYCITNYNIV